MTFKLETENRNVISDTEVYEMYKGFVVVKTSIDLSGFISLYEKFNHIKYEVKKDFLLIEDLQKFLEIQSSSTEYETLITETKVFLRDIGAKYNLYLNID
jgi:hypothetical protein